MEKVALKKSIKKSTTEVIDEAISMAMISIELNFVWKQPKIIITIKECRIIEFHFTFPIVAAGSKYIPYIVSKTLIGITMIQNQKRK